MKSNLSNLKYSPFFNLSEFYFGVLKRRIKMIHDKYNDRVTKVVLIKKIISQLSDEISNSLFKRLVNNINSELDEIDTSKLKFL